MEEKEYSNLYAIPANYTDSGKLLGGMLEVRNTVETVLLLLAVGYPILMWVPVSGVIKVVLMTVTLLPLGIVALMGIAGDSLLQYLGHIILFWARRGKLHYRRIGYRYDTTNGKRGSRKESSRKPKEKEPAKPEQDRIRAGLHTRKGYPKRYR